jgi:hypothetical protein
MSEGVAIRKKAAEQRQKQDGEATPVLQPYALLASILFEQLRHVRFSAA